MREPICVTLQDTKRITDLENRLARIESILTETKSNGCQWLKDMENAPPIDFTHMGEATAKAFQDLARILLPAFQKVNEAMAKSKPYKRGEDVEVLWDRKWRKGLYAKYLKSSATDTREHYVYVDDAMDANWFAFDEIRRPQTTES